MRYLIALIGALVLLAAITPVSAVEWHTGTWTDSDHAVGHPASELATGGYFESNAGVSNGWVCYDTTNTTLKLKRVSGTFSVNRTSGDDTFYLIAGNSCGIAAIYPNGTSGSPLTDQTFDYSPNLSTGYRYIGFQWGGGTNHRRLSDINFYWDEFPTVTANFTATPTQGSAPLYVSFNDTSEWGITAWNWSISPETGWLAGPYDLDNEDLTVLFTANGNYSVTHGVSNAYSSDIETKTDYIWIFNSTATVTTPFTAVDLAFANPINGASISLYDIQNSSWTNGTTGADGKVSITTLAEHTINGYATAAGYDDAELLGVDAYSGGHTFYMYPAGYTNVSSGNVTVFISVVDDSNFGTALPGVTVTGMVGSTTQIGTTDGAGIVRFVFPNSTDVHFGATKAGYAGTTVTINTGIPSGGSAAVTGTIHMFRGAVTATPTITGGATTTITVDPHPCVGDGSYQDTLNCQRKQGEMGADLIAYGPDLVNFFIMLTFIGGLALMMKGFR